jgi:hypothetical protein
MNDTKWDELRLAMYGLGTPPRWRTRDVENGHESEWNRGWYYHFRAGGYETIEWVDIEATSPEQVDAIRAVLARIHVPGEITSVGFRVYGYVPTGFAVAYISAA